MFRTRETDVSKRKFIKLYSEGKSFWEVDKIIRKIQCRIQKSF